MEQLKFSVLISTYRNDNPVFLRTALQSLFDQTLLPNQIVLVVDGPILPELENVISDFKVLHPDILDIYPLEKNVGLGPALNYGLLKCRNELVARMDSDDISLKHRFQLQLEYLHQHPEIDVLGANVEEFSKTPGDLQRINKSPVGSELYKYSRWRNPINHPAVIFKKSAVITSNSYEDVPYFEDYYLWINLLAKGYKFHNLQDVLLLFRNDIDTIGRRQGFAYIKHEISFLNKAYANSYLELPYYLMGFAVRLPLRILPKGLLSKFYHYFLRS